MRALIIAASACAIAFALVPATASAQEMFSPIQGYGTLGYAGANADSDANVGAIQGRLGARFGRYFGLEGELAAGVKNDTVDIAGVSTEVKLRHEEAAYGVGFVPLSPHFDLVGRVGYGHSSYRASAAGVSLTDGEDSVNYGAGAQYTFDDHNGLRADYTRHDFRHGLGDADVWSLAYLRKF